ncbi:DUF4214 domain-containing protein [Pigmentiphaga aceris]|uniref:DUF4214 domain-containing protein n=1 Tax=Pigmentiphaga aceris TaxID=1940612 RepID=A0A5C0B6S2_9BURK|nr:DUF4214 domain-containing protein [Pigmentiphaga aceris]QEI08661.1 DUF4214 domain-containing protein [Pigmentiphaga aceris]
MAVITPAQQTEIANLYTALFNRAPDAAGFEFWSQAVANGASPTSLISAFLTSPESVAIYGPSQTAEQFVATFYQTVFGRAPDSAGLKFWSDVLNAAGGVESDAGKAVLVASIVQVVSTPMTTKPEGLSDAQYAETVKDRDAFSKKAVIGLEFAVTLQSNDMDAAKQAFADVVGVPPVTTPTPTSPPTPTTPTPPTTPTIPKTPTIPTAPTTPTTPPASNLSLTTGQDTKTGTAGDDVFDAKQINGLDTLTAGDVLDGGAGIDTLNVSLSSSTGAAATLRNIEIVNLTPVGSNVLLDLGSLTGLQQANIVNIPIDSQVRIENVGAAALSISARDFASFASSKVSFTGSTASTLKLSFDRLAYSLSTPLQLTLEAQASAIDVITESSSVELLKTANSADIREVKVTATSYSSLKLSERDASKVTSITVSGTGSVEFSGRELSALETLVVGDGGVTLKSIGSNALDINTGRGNDTIAVNGASVRTLNVGGGADFITVNGNALASDALINLGSGNDILSVLTGMEDGAEIDGGDGDDTLNLTLISPLSLAPILRNIETVNVSAQVAGAGVDLAGSGARVIQVTGGTFGANVSGVGDATLAVSGLYGAAAVGFDGSAAAVLSLSLKRFGYSGGMINVNLAAAGNGPAATAYAIRADNVYVQLLGEAANLTEVTVRQPAPMQSICPHLMPERSPVWSLPAPGPSTFPARIC